MRVKRPVCQECQQENNRMYTRNDKGQFIPSGWLCIQCNKPKLSAPTITTATDVTPMTTVQAKNSDNGLEERLTIVTQERDEYRDALSRLMQEHPEQTFQNASGMTSTANANANANTVTPILKEIKMPVDKFSKFFIATQKAKEFMLLNIEDGKVVGWTTY